ncbi:MAG: hypothetical protein D6719_10500 [Candidatus Dadabacteria bacterium]|nr:MAG: hypothetical protein D6719_10500 [Candidatus Dadabacteria bacterium]
MDFVLRSFNVAQHQRSGASPVPPRSGMFACQGCERLTWPFTGAERHQNYKQIKRWVASCSRVCRGDETAAQITWSGAR